MKIEESFVKALITTKKKFPVLDEAPTTKVKVTVIQIMQIGKEFHKVGYDNGSNILSALDQFFKQP